MKLKQLICLLLAALLLGACGSPAAPTEATEETKPTDAGWTRSFRVMPSSRRKSRSRSRI